MDAFNFVSSLIQNARYKCDLIQQEVICVSVEIGFWLNG